MNEDLMITDDDLVIMLRHIELYFQSGLTKDSYCVQNNVTISTFSNILQAFSVLNHKSSNSHKKMMDFVTDYLTMPVENKKEEVYCKNNKINLNTFKGYLRSAKLIDRATQLTNGAFDFMALCKAQKWPKRAVFPENPMSFVEIPSVPSVPTEVEILSTSLVVEERTKNQIQISIPSGISVTLPPSTTQESVIKIIELLKDL